MPSRLGSFEEEQYDEEREEQRERILVYARRRVSHEGLRPVAREIPMSPSGLQMVLNAGGVGAAPPDP